MDRRLMMVLAVCLASHTVARADIAYPWYERVGEVWMRNVKTPRVRFEGIEKNTEYIFYLQYSLNQFSRREFFEDPYDPIEIKDDNAIELNIGDHGFSSIRMIAVKRVNVEKMGKDAKGWLNDKTPGVLIANLESPELYIRKTLCNRSPGTPGILANWRS